LLPWCNEQGVMLESFAELSRQIDGMMAEIAGSMWALLALEFIAAAFGIANTLTINVLEQTREVGLLRVVAMTRQQIRRTVLLQALIMGIVGLAPGCLMGAVLAYCMNAGTLPLLGQQVEFVFHPLLLGACLLAALAIVVVGAWLPARRAANLELAVALRSL
jgi:putative ABC transport system permease protein